MLKSIRDSFRIYFNILLWLLFLASGAYGVFYGSTIGQFWLKFIFNDDEEHPIWGAIIFGAIGLFIGYIVLVLLFGIITTILNIDENLQTTTKIYKHLATKKQLSSFSKPSVNLYGYLYEKDIVSLSDKKWICKKCGTVNELTLMEGNIIITAGSNRCIKCYSALDGTKGNYNLVDLQIFSLIPGEVI